MDRTKLIVNLAAAAIVAVAVIVGFRIWKTQTTTGEADGFDPRPVAAGDPQSPGNGIPGPDPNRSARQAVLRELADRAAKALSGPPSAARADELHAISAEAVAKLGPTPELMDYIQFLAAAGAMDERERMLSAGTCGLFSGPRAAAALDWLPTIPDATLRTRLGRSAGEVSGAEGFAAVFERFGEKADHNTLAAFLYGHCEATARKDPAEAIRVYKELGYPRRIDNTGMASVMAAVPADSDFPALAGGISDDRLSLAKQARGALLRNWAGIRPQQAAEYVLAAKPEVVHPDQMAVVMERWIARDPDAAATWLSKAPKGLPADEGLAAVARHFAKIAPARAWTFVIAITDPGIRRPAADRVAMEWRRTDPRAANEALAKAGTK